MTNNNMTLFDEIYSHFGNECHCGGDALKCDDECCPERGMCLKDVLTKLKTRLDEPTLDEIKQSVEHIKESLGFYVEQWEEGHDGLDVNGDLLDKLVYSTAKHINQLNKVER